MYQNTDSFEANNPKPCWSMPSPDSPALEMEAAGDAQARAMQLMSDRAADAAWVAEMEAAEAKATTATPAAPKTIRCKCGLEKNGAFWIISPRTDRRVSVWVHNAHLLTSNIRAKIQFGHIAGHNIFTTAELSKIFEVSKLQDLVSSAPVRTQMTFQRKIRR
jgi:hypothetical protein